MIQASESQSPGWLTHVHILPAAGTDGGRDTLLSSAAGVAIVAMCGVGVAIPAALVYAATGSATTASLVLYAGLMVVLVAIAMTVVHWMRLDARGITLGRRSGGPRFVAWNDVTGIRPATRREVIVDGWLWPPVPPREATRCPSSLGHFRIDHRGGHLYFPPADPAQFLGAVEHWRSGASA
jgi:hypothetical protein